jgi:hypothetical protein
MIELPRFYHLRIFEDLLYDAVHLLYLAHDVDVAKDQRGYDYTCTRGSVFNSLLLFECGANCCIDALTLPQVFKEDIDKLPFLSKYELFLSRINPDAKFDRGCKEVQASAELKEVRDSFVHPKVRKRLFSTSEGAPNDFGETTYLRVPRNPSRWHCIHAARALSAVNEFFNLFFLVWCNFDTDTVCELLLGYDRANIPAKSSTFVDGIGGLNRAVQEFGIDFRFIGKRID